MPAGGIVRFAVSVCLGGALFYADAGLNAFDRLRGDMALVLTPFRFVARAPERMLVSAEDYLRDRETLLAERDGLRAQIREMQVRANSLDFFAEQNDNLRQILKLQRDSGGQWIAAEVTADGRRAFAGRISLNRGERDGVLPGMAVVDEQGVAGQVVRVEADASVVNLITDGEQWLACRVKRTGALAAVRGAGDGGGELSVEFMNKDADLQIGDELVADGGAYPPGYPVGNVISLDRPTGDIHLTARVLPHSRPVERRILLVYAADAHE